MTRERLRRDVALMEAAGGLAFTLLIVGIVLVSTLVPLALTGFFLYRFFKGQADANKLLQTGEAAQAQILGVSQTGTYINNQPEVMISASVMRQGQAPYPAQIRMVVGMIHLPRVQPGATVPCKVDPADPSKVMLDLNAPAGMPQMAGPMPGAPMAPMGQAVPMGAAAGVAVPGAAVAMPGAGVAMPGAGVAVPGAGVPPMGQAAAYQPPPGQPAPGAVGATRSCGNCGTPIPAHLPRCPRCGM